MIHLSRENWVATTNAQADAIHIMDAANCEVTNYSDGWILLTVPVSIDFGEFVLIMDRMKNLFRDYILMTSSTEEVQYRLQLGVEHTPTWPQALLNNPDGHIDMYGGLCACGGDKCDGSCEDSMEEFDG